MSPSFVLLLALAIGIVAGLRALTAPAVSAWGANLRWLNLAHSPLAFVGSYITVAVFTLLALAELVNDKMPRTPARTAPPSIVIRCLMGGFAGACVATAGSEPWTLGALLGLVGSLVGTFGGYQLRTRLVKALGVPDYVVALSEDAIAVLGGLFIVSRF